MTDLRLSKDQEKAWAKLLKWSTAPPSSHPYFVLRGYAGTGKTYLLQLLTKTGVPMIFTAPTNKATKVLSKAVGHEASTTYSALGLRMVQDEDSTKMEFGDKIPYIPAGTVFVVDEGSMAGTELCRFLDRARVANQFKILYVGDPAQLPPVGEDTSPCWQVTKDPECRAFLKEVMRFDNQLLTTATAIRNCLVDEHWKSPIVDDHDEFGGVYLLSEKRFRRSLLNVGGPEDFAEVKLVAWRNKTVNAYNARVRESFKFQAPYCVGDRLLLAEPVKVQSIVAGYVDDEVRVEEVVASTASLADAEIPVWRLQTLGDSYLELVIPSDPAIFNRVLSVRADEARKAKGIQRKILWRQFWELKEKFHSVRYGYCLTAHRSQGSTYTHTFVDQRDILANQDKDTAFRCLYVACTRATDSLITF